MRILLSTSQSEKPPEKDTAAILYRMADVHWKKLTYPLAGNFINTTQDIYDRITEDDLKKSSIIMAIFAYNSATSNEKLPRKTNPNLNTASVFSGVNLQALSDEKIFAESGLNFSICGHALDADEMHETHFPSVLTVGTNYSHLGE